MKRLAFFALFGIAAALPALGDDVPFAEPSPPMPGAATAYPASLSDIMTGAQLRHIKLWEAIKAKNWDLANFEMKQIQANLAKAAMLYSNIPMEFVDSAMKPLIGLQQAVASKDETRAARSFADLTDACNMCHEAAGIGFVVIHTPTASPFSNQKFAPN
ncbi:MAG: hypothetical protein WDN46_20780 [Methylocella sp.]